MPVSEKNIFDPKTIFSTWMRSMADMSSASGEADFKKEPEPPSEKDNVKGSWFDKHLESGMSAWQTLMTALSQPETLASIYNSIGSFPDFFLKMIQPMTDGVSSMYGQWLSQFKEIGKISGDFHFDQFDQIDKESLNVFTSLYDAEFRKFLNIPPLGLTRQYQEKINRFLDRFNLLNSAMAEFMHMVFQPFGNANAAFQKKISEMVEANQVPDDPKSFYQTWLKLLEKEYMLLFKSSEYLSCLAKALNAVAEYQKARQDLINGMLHQFSIPSSTDVESVYKDLYDLKKRLKKIEKAMATK